jgi:hypothetical protein
VLALCDSSDVSPCYELDYCRENKSLVWKERTRQLLLIIRSIILDRHDEFNSLFSVCKPVDSKLIVTIANQVYSSHASRPDSCHAIKIHRGTRVPQCLILT